MTMTKRRERNLKVIQYLDRVPRPTFFEVGLHFDLSSNHVFRIKRQMIEETIKETILGKTLSDKAQEIGIKEDTLTEWVEGYESRHTGGVNA